MMEKISPGYYATNLRALRHCECVRLGGGLLSGTLSWIIGKFLPPQGREKMPTDYDEIESTFEEFSNDLKARVEQAVEELRPLGFKPIGWQRFPSEKEEVIDSGSVISLSGCRTIVGLFSVIINKDETASGGYRYTEVLSLNSYYRSGKALCVADSNLSLDPLPGTKLVFMKGELPARLMEKLIQERERIEEKV